MPRSPSYIVCINRKETEVNRSDHIHIANHGVETALWLAMVRTKSPAEAVMKATNDTRLGEAVSLIADVMADIKREFGELVDDKGEIEDVAFVEEAD